MVTQATRSRRCADVGLGFDGFCSVAVKSGRGSSDGARKSRVRSGTVDVRVQNAVAQFRGAQARCVLANAFCIRELLKRLFRRDAETSTRDACARQSYKHAKLFAEPLAELCARVFAVEFRDKTRADLGGTHRFALISIGAITKSLFVHYLHHF